MNRKKVPIVGNRRMFSNQIIDTDPFGDMPTTAQLLYFYLGMAADDDGFVSNPKRTMRDCRSNDDDLKILIAKKFILTFDSGVVVIRGWQISNYIQPDHYTQTIHSHELRQLVQDETGAYLSLSDRESVTAAIDSGVRVYPIFAFDPVTGKAKRVKAGPRTKPGSLPAPLTSKQIQEGFDQGRLIQATESSAEPRSQLGASLAPDWSHSGDTIELNVIEPKETESKGIKNQSNTTELSVKAGKSKGSTNPTDQLKSLVTSAIKQNDGDRTKAALMLKHQDIPMDQQVTHLLDTKGSEYRAKQKKQRIDDDFEELWKMYPIKDGKQVAKKAYRADARKDGAEKTKAAVTEAITNYLADYDAKNPNGDRTFLKHGGNFFGQRVWQDWLDRPTSETQKKPFGMDPRESVYGYWIDNHCDIDQAIEALHADEVPIGDDAAREIMEKLAKGASEEEALG